MNINSYNTMHKFFSILFCLFYINSLQGQVAERDTVKSIDNVNSLIINQHHRTSTTIIATTNDNHDGFIYEVETRDTSKLSDKDWYMNLPFVNLRNNKSSVRTITCLNNIYLGWNFNYDGKGAIKNRMEGGVMEVVGVNLKPFKMGPEIDFGIGLGVREYDTKEGWRFDKAEGILYVIPTEGESMKNSRLTSWSFHVPVTLTQRIYKKLAITAGTLLNFNTYATAKSQYFYNDIKYTEKYKGLKQQFFTADVIGMVGIKECMGIYFRWSPMPLFKNFEGPEFKSVSIGLTVNY